jgi:hypothetical protein
MLNISVIKAKRNGLEVFKVYVNRCLATECLSKAGALTYIKTKFGNQIIKSSDLFI